MARETMILGMNARVFRWAVLLVGCLGLCLARSALAAPSHAGLFISEGAGCRVLLTKMSYDDPGADDAELLELFVERSADAGAPTDAGRVPRDGAAGTAMLTLGDCGLGALELVNGGGGACDTYRTIPLSSLPIPPDAYLVFCATDSVLAPACDVKAAGLSALRNGWLQNGPSDGLRFVDRDGSAALELAYEGAPPCFAANARHLADETGQLTGASDPTDDVNTFCGAGFALLSPAAAPLRDDAHCPVALPRAPGDAAVTTQGGVSSSDSGAAERPWTTERAPKSPSSDSPAASALLEIDAGLVALAKTPSAPPKPPGCAVVPGRTFPSGPVGGWPFVVAISLICGLTRRGCGEQRQKWRRPHFARPPHREAHVAKM